MTNYAKERKLSEFKQGVVVKFKGLDMYGHVISFHKPSTGNKIMVNVLWADTTTQINENIEDLEIL